MFKQYKTFYSMLLLTLLSTAIVLIMYTYTVNTSLDTVRDDIRNNNLNRIRFLVNNLDHNVEQLNMLATALQTDSKVGLLPSIDLLDSYEQIQLVLDLTDKMKLQSFSEGWNNQISIFSDHLSRWIGTTSERSAPPTESSAETWSFDPNLGRFSSYRVQEGFTIRVTFPKNNLREMLDRAKIENNVSFFYQISGPVIPNQGANKTQITEVLDKLKPYITGSDEGSVVITVKGIDYMANFIRSEKLGFYAVDYMPLDVALQPIEKTRTFFYIACCMLFLAGVAIVSFLYRKVQIPIITLLKSVRLLKRGNFGHRITRMSRNEFDLLYENFNDMAAQIEDLIEKVYKEKIISREAMVKQLQAQINPHFLYNCLFFINNMTRLGNDEAVTAMTHNLAQYFRYTTRLNEPLTTLEKELGVVENYLNIQCLRMERLRYQIDVPDTMKRLSVPKLLLQPLVENSVIHGIERKKLAGFIRITGYEGENQYSLVIEDDGKGMSLQDIQLLQQRIKQPIDDTMGCALWNIVQRMHIHFDPSARMEIGQSELGGLCVTLRWPIHELEE
jgi:two-component system sensor histidine kinase YesM